MRRYLYLSLFFVVACFSRLGHADDQLVRIEDVDPTVLIDLRYATSDNFTHQTVYPLAVGILRSETARKLAAANQDLKRYGYRLKVWDAYRPPYVQKIFWGLVPDDRYVANPYKGGSRHNRGGAVDVTLVDANGQELEMPSAFDDFSSRAWPNNFALSNRVRANLRILRQVMMAHGFLPLEHEWWHFDDAAWKKFPLIDVPLESFLIPPNVLKDPALRSSNEVVIVEGQEQAKFKARLIAWQKLKEGWKAVLVSRAVVGRNGIALLNAKREGDGKTPSGIYELGLAFGAAQSLETKMPYRQASSQDIWVDDIASSNYNRWIIRSELGDAKSFEELKRKDDLYQAGLVIEYNTKPVTPGLGSAIFMHVWRSEGQGTAGCVALPAEKLYQLLKWLDPKDKPMIVIGAGN